RRDPVDRRPQQLRGEQLRRVRCPAEQDGGGVADPALELAGYPVRLGQPTEAGGVPDQEGAVLASQHHRRDGRGLIAESGDLGHAVPPDGRGGIGGAEVDADYVHEGSGGRWGEWGGHEGTTGLPAAASIRGWCGGTPPGGAVGLAPTV